MDFFNIGRAVPHGMQQFAQGSRRTGRTTKLIASLRDGDRVIFATVQEAGHFRRQCHPLKIECLVRSPIELHELQPAEGRTVFDHGWVERFYERAAATVQEREEWLSRPSLTPCAPARTITGEWK